MNKTSHHPVYKNPQAPIDKRVGDLLSRMTSEEKAGQMTCVWQQKAAFRKGHGTGQVGRSSGADLQKVLLTVAK